MESEGSAEISSPVVEQGAAPSAQPNAAGAGIGTSLSSRAKDLVRRALSKFVDYRFNWIVAQDAEMRLLHPPNSIEVKPLENQHNKVFAQHADERVRSALNFERAGCRGFVLVAASEPVGLIHFADVSRYESDSTWPLASDEVALVNVITLPAYRSRGYASALIAEATASLVPEHYTRAIAYIWWTTKHHCGRSGPQGGGVSASR